jgi:hypothetical protein
MIIEILPLFKERIELVQDAYPNTAKPTWINVNNISDIETIKHFHEYRNYDQVYGPVVTRKEFKYYLLKMTSGSEIPIGEDEFNKILEAQK